MARLQGKVAFITGGTIGIGRNTAVMFAKEGAKVVVTGRKAESGNETIRLVKAAGGEGTYIQTDITQQDQVEKAIAETVAKYGSLDVLMNNAGGSTAKDGPVHECPIEEFWAAINLNLFGTWLCCRSAMPHMMKQQSGSVINVSSIVGLTGITKRDAYTASKGAVISLTRSMAAEYAKYKIRVNTLVPGTVATERVTAMMVEPQVKKLIEGTPLGVIQPDEIASAAVFLAADESRTMTGQILS
ncbi:MAG: SDR family oxidoreductase, partial [Rhodospirillaceae bacterium]|nr:SDR family oxidoreductase [Rhodospirillaceae bacterium]